MTKQNFWNAETEVFELQEIYPPEERARKVAEEFFTDINWELALRTGAWVQVGAFSGREFLEIIASAIREAERVAVEREREAIIEAAENERVSGETGEESDFAYNNAIEHVVAAIRLRGDKQDG